MAMTAYVVDGASSILCIQMNTFGMDGGGIVSVRAEHRGWQFNVLSIATVELGREKDITNGFSDIENGGGKILGAIYELGGVI